MSEKGFKSLFFMLIFQGGHADMTSVCKTISWPAVYLTVPLAGYPPSLF